MNNKISTPLQTREVFHLEFLRWFGRKLETECYCLKGGTNLRFFFQSIRYSEDMDIDIHGVRVERVKKTVMEILSARGLTDSLKSFGIERVVPPEITKAKQTQTTQRFKIHLLTTAGEDLFTKIEFSRRGMKGRVLVEPVSSSILRSYKMAPLLVPHYDAASAVAQKIQALAQRSVIQARDIFDLFLLSSQRDRAPAKSFHPAPTVLKTACDNVFLVDFPQFRDTVVAYLGDEDQKAYSSPGAWDGIRLRTVRFLEEFKNENR
ncbi:MAG: nucleotidyl transferase AbiEii/AbiGii toxin family protein [Candidatus Omnitrophica bacterium]|nr:nucleotidyl transferase AbiEii/AbiGii toxin family protein [Candidatus Omnitrophota bacterium]